MNICPKCAASTRPGTVDGRRYESVCMACGPVSAATYATMSGCEAQKTSSPLPGRRGQIPLPAGNKYGATKTEVDGITFDSMKEARRYKELSLLQAAGEIENLQLQPKFEFVVNGVKVASYHADFQYRRGPELIVEDCKSEATRKIRDYPIRKKLLLALYGISLTEV